jgi:hypothetical protein
LVSKVFTFETLRGLFGNEGWRLFRGWMVKD